MKKLITLSVLYITLFLCILFVGVSHGSNIQTPPMTGGGEVQEQVLTPEQIEALQLSTDILGMCVFDRSYDYIFKYNFATETAISKGFQECSDELKNLVVLYQEAEFSDGKIAVILTALYKQAVYAAKNRQNEIGEGRLQQDKAEELERAKKNSI